MSRRTAASCRLVEECTVWILVYVAQALLSVLLVTVGGGEAGRGGRREALQGCLAAMRLLLLLAAARPFQSELLKHGGFGAGTAAQAGAGAGNG